jgi:putative two-component system response regulator
MRILIADDEELARDLLQMTLIEAGHEVVSASTGDEAMKHFHAGDFQVVISDWMMPGMSGLDLCRTIRQRTTNGYVYVILLTARDSSESRVEGFAAGADDFITKPFDPDELSSRIRVAERVLALESRDVTIFALAKLAESRDPETGAHLERVQSYAQVLAAELLRQGLHPDLVDASYVKLIHETSPLHDIGKVAIPDFVLLKPGRLSDDEFDIMKSHTTLGAQTLRAAAARRPGTRFLIVAGEIAASHHEKWDGTGYPDGLKGTDIPLSGRIVAVADVYDALTSKRVYKPAFTHAAAKSILIKDRGTHFDPDVVDAFLANEQKFIEIQTRYADGQAKAAAAAA